MDGPQGTMDDPRAAALRLARARRAFRRHAAAYVLINAAVIGVWAAGPRWVFWPLAVLLFWGIGLAFHAWAIYVARVIAEDDHRESLEPDTAS